MNIFNAHARKLLPLSVALALSNVNVVFAQDEEQREAVAQQIARQMEEVFVQGRLLDNAQSLAVERIEQPYSAEILGFEQIERIGDPNIASALRRVTGLTLVDGKYIYVRGLGERYSSTTLNGAPVPSPELTRNVIPLDLFPTSILDSIKAYKAYSPDQPAAFGGGNIDIRTKGIPSDFVFDISLGTGWSQKSSDDGYKTVGDGGDLPNAIAAAINTYAGNLQPSNITNFMNTDGGVPNAAERAQGEAINRDLLLSLNRDIGVESDSLDPDRSASLALGNKWYISDDISFGALVNLDQENKFRNEDQFESSYSNPEQDFSQVTKTVEEENFTGAINLGVSYQDKHTISTNSYLLQNDEDQAAIVLSHNPDFLLQDGRQRKTYITRMEKRELEAHQILGKHIVEPGEFYINNMPAFVREFEINWIYSDATASTSIPNGTSVQASNSLDLSTGELLSTAIDAGNSSQFNFLDLEDQVESGGFELKAIIEGDNFSGSLSGGYLDTTKTREYYGYTVNINSSPLSPRQGLPQDIFTDSNLIDPNNGFQLSLGSNFGTESYIAAQTVEAIYGAVDFTYDNRWRFSAGARWEQFKQALLPVDLLDFNGNLINQQIEDLQDPNQRYAFSDDDLYPTLALTYIGDGFLNSENFQLRFSYGSTVVRPDLREVADIQFIDPELITRVQGNPNLVYSEIDHFDIRSEFFFSDGSNFTVSLFYKDIANPIETVRRPGPQDARLLSFDNAENGEVYGIELEGLKELGMGFFISGNIVLSDSELEFAENTSQTSRKRRLTGHSEYVVNTQLGFDSEGGKHSMSAAYNVFGERVFYGGLSPEPDAFEQPFHSLDLVYSYYPTDNATVTLKFKNLLNQSETFEQEGTNGGSVTIIEKEVGTSMSLGFKYRF